MNIEIERLHDRIDSLVEQLELVCRESGWMLDEIEKQGLAKKLSHEFKSLLLTIEDTKLRFLR